MPVFATPGKLSDFILSKEMPALGRRRKTLASLVLMIALFTPTLPFFTFPDSASTRVPWTGLDILGYIRGTATMPLPLLARWVERTSLGVWNPLFLAELAVTYACMLLYAIGIAFSRLRRLLRFAGLFGVFSALGTLRSGRWPFDEYLPQARAGAGLYVLLVLAVILAVIPEWETLDA